MYDTILVPTDGSDHAMRAARHASVLADAFDATVHVVSAVDGADADADAEALEANARDAIDAAAAAVGDAPVESAVLDGAPTTAVREYVEASGVDLVVMGTHGRTGVNRFVAGSVTESVLRDVDVPVVAVRADGDDRPEYDDVLVPTDASEAAVAAVDHALAVAEATDATVHALNVAEAAVARGSPSFSVPSEMQSVLESVGEQAVEGIADRARDAGLDARTAVVEGSAPDVILDYVEDAGIDLVAMGTHGDAGLTRFLVGSTTERVLRRSPAPVLAVTADREE